MFPLPIAVLESVTLMQGTVQFALVVGLSFSAIVLLVSFLRFQRMTGHLAMPAEDEEFQAANLFQTELLRRMGGGRSQHVSLVVAYIGLLDRDTLGAQVGGPAGLQEVGRWMRELLNQSVRQADVVLQIDEERLGLILSSCQREQGVPVMERLLQTVRDGLCRTSNGWAGHVEPCAGCVVFPENGETMRTLIEELDEAFSASQSENGLVFAEPPARPVHTRHEGLLRDEEEDEEEEKEEEVESPESHEKRRVNPMVDPLTGVIRRDRIGTAMAKYMAAHRREGRAVTMLYLAVDHVERYIKQYGGGADDALLRMTGELLQRETREDDLLGRYGADGFLVLMHCPMAEGLAVARRLCASARRQQALHEKWPLRITISVGVAAWPEHGRTPGELFRLANGALEEARARGGNAALLFDRTFVRERRRHDDRVDRF